jgi:serine/threonine protein kinase/Tfp pilus assembly protein PilF
VSDQIPGAGLDTTLREFSRGQKLFGRYTLVKILGQGGMGVVWLARDEELERDVALKFLPDPVIHDRALLNELKRETRRCLELTHPHIVRIHDFVFNETSACISMEYVDGDTLANLRSEKEKKVFEPNEIAPWTGQLCNALDYAHNQARIVHRDLKPGNLMVNKKGDLKISDFGIARSLGDTVSRLTMEQGRSGTLVYMSPQQLDGEHGTHLDDIYSLGATLYDLLTSKPPFYSGNIDRQIHERVAPSMTERRKDLNIEPASVPAIWEEVVAACLQKDPAKRPQSAMQVANRLQLSSAPIRAKRTVPSKAILWAGAALVCVIGLGAWYLATSKLRTKAGAVATNALTQAAVIAEKNIAVLPFESFSDDKENAYFADGVQDDILTDLTKVADLKVISRRSVAQYRDTKQTIREIGKALGVAHVLEGSVRKVANRIHVTAQLIDTRTEVETWAEKYDRDIADVFQIQSDISQAIVTQLKAVLSPAEKAAIEEKPTQDKEAYDLYLRARALVYQQFGLGMKTVEENATKAITLLQSATARDPRFTLAYCVQGDAQLILFDLVKAKEAIDTALRISPNSAEAHLILARYFFEGVGDASAAEKELSVAAAGLPGRVDVFNLRARIEEQRGQWKQALRDHEKAAELDPRDGDTAFGLATLYISLRRYENAGQLLDRMMATTPQQSTGFFWKGKSWIALAKGDAKAAMAALDAHPLRNSGLWGLNHTIAYVFVMERDYAKAEGILQSVEETAKATNPKANPISDEFFGRGLTLERLGRIARFRGEKEKNHGYFEAARPRFEEWLAKHEGQNTWVDLSMWRRPHALAYIAEIDAALGRKEDAIREARNAVELWPLKRDAGIAQDMAILLAIVYMWTGERDAALQQLAEAARLPTPPTLLLAGCPAGLSAGELKLDPLWDDLRNDPRFDKIIAEAAKPIKLD